MYSRRCQDRWKPVGPTSSSGPLRSVKARPDTDHSSDVATGVPISGWASSRSRSPPVVIAPPCSARLHGATHRGRCHPANEGKREHLSPLSPLAGTVFRPMTAGLPPATRRRSAAPGRADAIGPSRPITGASAASPAPA
ncbi:hypothetical protein Ddc_23769 [Ditylenchus destructor]|nr:hypothetical protein Ddc_23769 [Ditylenchus destructor]